MHLYELHSQDERLLAQMQIAQLICGTCAASRHRRTQQVVQRDRAATTVNRCSSVVVEHAVSAYEKRDDRAHVCLQEFERHGTEQHQVRYNHMQCFYQCLRERGFVSITQITTPTRTHTATRSRTSQRWPQEAPRWPQICIHRATADTTNIYIYIHVQPCMSPPGDADCMVN